MPCDRTLKPRQSISQRKEEIARSVERLNRALASGSVRALVSKDGGIAFQGFGEQDRDGLGDVCAYRRIMASGSVAAKMAIAKAEQLAGRSIDKQKLAAGLHSHDGGASWHHHKG